VANAKAATSCRGRIVLHLLDSNETVIKVGGGRLNIVSTINGKPKKDCKQVNSTANLPETRLRLTGPVFYRKLHVQSIRKHADAMSLMQIVEYAPMIFVLSLNTHFLSFVKGRWLS
jgi:hypothetical protein